MTKPLTRAQLEKLWRTDHRGPQRGPGKKQRLDPGRKPTGAMTNSDLQNLPAEKWPEVWPDVWKQRKEKR